MMSLKSLFVLGALAGVGVSADLRAASQPRAGFVVRQRNAVKFASNTVIYMEPSAFNYAGLKQQRQAAYDNFLRSNIDNEQDKRNFNNENGRDMLPFRSYEGAPTDASNTVQTKIPDGAPGPVITAAPGQEILYPFRWNNPHASELEVNIWIMNVPNAPVVVPIRKPTCSGEGHQDVVISFTVPANFNQLGETVPGFVGCKKEGDCVLQIYAHSVEPRTYAIGVPIVVTGDVAPATGANGIQAARQDVGLDLGRLGSDLCLSSASPDADIKEAVPRAARLASDVFNHAYQNSDYSPYSGQQPEAISRNLQASTIISMIPANQGELGAALLKQQKPAAAAFAANLRNKVQNLVKKYEGIVNNIIAKVGDKTMKDTAVLGANNVQKLANCFRCAETGSVTTTRQTTNTYVPSFQLQTAQQVTAAKALVPAKYANLISASNVVQIYQATLETLKGEFQKAQNMGLQFQPAVLKTTMTTMADKTDFKKRNANGQTDGGVYAASQAQAAKKAAAAGVSQNLNAAATLVSPLAADVEGDSLPDISAFGAEETVVMTDLHGFNRDTACDDDRFPTDKCAPPQPLFALDAEGNLEEVPEQAAPASSSGLSSGAIAGIGAGVGVVAILAVGVAVVKHRRNKQTTVTSTEGVSSV